MSSALSWDAGAGELSGRFSLGLSQSEGLVFSELWRARQSAVPIYAISKATLLSVVEVHSALSTLGECLKPYGLKLLAFATPEGEQVGLSHPSFSAAPCPSSGADASVPPPASLSVAAASTSQTLEPA